MRLPRDISVNQYSSITKYMTVNVSVRYFASRTIPTHHESNFSRCTPVRTRTCVYERYAPEYKVYSHGQGPPMKSRSNNLFFEGTFFVKTNNLPEFRPHELEVCRVPSPPSATVGRAISGYKNGLNGHKKPMRHCAHNDKLPWRSPSWICRENTLIIFQTPARIW